MLQRVLYVAVADGHEHEHEAQPPRHGARLLLKRAHPREELNSRRRERGNGGAMRFCALRTEFCFLIFCLPFPLYGIEL